MEGSLVSEATVSRGCHTAAEQFVAAHTDTDPQCPASQERGAPACRAAPGSPPQGGDSETSAPAGLSGRKRTTAAAEVTSPAKRPRCDPLSAPCGGLSCALIACAPSPEFGLSFSATAASAGRWEVVVNEHRPACHTSRKACERLAPGPGLGRLVSRSLYGCPGSAKVSTQPKPRLHQSLLRTGRRRCRRHRPRRTWSPWRARTASAARTC